MPVLLRVILLLIFSLVAEFTLFETEDSLVLKKKKVEKKRKKSDMNLNKVKQLHKNETNVKNNLGS